MINMYSNAHPSVITLIVLPLGKISKIFESSANNQEININM
ncbi:MAG: hypothetical protein VXZ40_00205 [Nanoarchaeota archaeon]|nr:hypothetical protein [Nanoarchaeota archaeon]